MIIYIKPLINAEFFILTDDGALHPLNCLEIAIQYSKQPGWHAADDQMHP